MKAKTLRPILGDQLNARHSWFENKDSETLYVMMELAQETSYVVHHRQKVLAFFKAMRNFAKALEAAGHRIFYIKLDDACNQQSLTQNLLWLLEETGAERIECQQPDEYRLDHQLKSWAGVNSLNIKWFSSEHFLTGRSSLDRYFPDTDNYLMETFYRKIRVEYDLLMDNGKPAGGRWNYDKDNQKKLPKKQQVPQPLVFSNDVSDIDDMLSAQNIKTIGNGGSKAVALAGKPKTITTITDAFL